MKRFLREINAIFMIAFRDILKFLRDPGRIISTLILPVIIVGVLGTSFQINIGKSIGYNFLNFTFTGIFAYVLFQSTSLGVVSLAEERENSSSQGMFLSPISRYSIISGKILGESIVAMVLAVFVIAFGLLIGIPFTPLRALSLLIVGALICLLGGAFGLIALSIFRSQRAAYQMIPYLIYPQLFLAGVFTPIQVLPWYLDALSRISPLRYVVDLARDVFFAGQSEYTHVVLLSPVFNSAILIALFVVFLLSGTTLFVRSANNR